MYPISPCDIVTTKTITSFKIDRIEITLFKSAIITVILLDSAGSLLDVKFINMNGEDYAKWNEDDSYVIDFIKQSLGFSSVPIVEPVSNIVEEPVSNPVSNVVEEPVSNPVSNVVEDPVSNPVSNVIEDPVSNVVEEPIIDVVLDPVSNVVEEPVINIVEDPVSDPVLDTP